MKCKNTECNNETSGNRVYCSLTCRNVFVNKYLRDYNKVSDTFNKKKITREVDYLKDAKHCKECNSLIPFDKKNNDFCNKSCSTTYINKNRDTTWNDKISESIKRYISINGVFGCLSDKLLIEKVCINCNEKFTNKNKKFCKKSCRVNYNRRIMDDYQRYKSDCQFKFNLSNYSDYFDFNLVKEHGWYSPTNKNNNLGGISRDHIFSIREGYERDIDPKIISHPANCRLMIHSKNISKHKKSDITIEELLIKIENFNKIYETV